MERQKHWWSVLLVTALSLHGGYVSAQSPGDEFNNLLVNICIGFPPPELAALCAEFSGDGGSGGPGGGVGGSNNLGTLDAQNQTAIREGIESRLKEQRKTKKDNQLGAFVTLESGNRERKATELENGYDSDDSALLVGLDYRVSSKLLGGAIFTFAQFESEFDASAGELETRGVSATLFTSYTYSEHAFVDAYLGFGTLEYENTRNILVTTQPKRASSETDGTQTLFGVNAHFGWPRGPWAFGFDIKIDYVNTEIDNYAETGNTNYLLIYPDQDLTSLTTSFGFDVAYSKSFSWGVLVPNFQILYVHEAEDEAREVITGLKISPTNTFITRTDEPDKDYVITNLGASATLPRNFQLFGEFSLLSNHEFLDSWALNVGLRKQF